MKKTTFLVILTVIFSFAYTQNYIAPHEILHDTVWDADTMFLKSDLHVDSEATLTIKPGTVVMSDGFWGMYVDGCIKAIGTEDNRIQFTAKDTVSYADSSIVTGGWKGFYFIEVSYANDSSIFDYCVLEYGKAFGNDKTEQNGGVLYVKGLHKIRISNSIIQNNSALKAGGGLYMETCSGIVVNNAFYNNKTYWHGGGISMGPKSNGIISSNLFKYNTAYFSTSTSVSGSGGAIYVKTKEMETHSPEIINNKCFNNIGPSGIIYASTMESLIANNMVCNNYGTPIMVGHSLSENKIINNTIANNNSIMSLSYRSITVPSKKVAVVNNILWNNYKMNKMKLAAFSIAIVYIINITIKKYLLH